ncbi:methyltransferase fkbM domain-containing protein [Ditylenchus destructor]|nr:methyltransferase fkbM domain-containing protein [Ditylenchus destructor]
MMSCNVVTIGVGRDVTAEKLISFRYPQCQFLGADPDGQANQPLYLNLPNSRFIATAVAGNSGRFTGSFLQPSGNYKHETRNHMGFADFLKEYNGDQLIDLLIMDNEGGEFSVFDVMNGVFFVR